MHQPDHELVRRLYSKEQPTDAAYAQQCKLEIAREFKKQLLLGLPTKQDEWTLRRLSAQLKEDKVCVKLYVAEPLHAKLYLALYDYFFADFLLQRAFIPFYFCTFAAIMIKE